MAAMLQSARGAAIFRTANLIAPALLIHPSHSSIYRTFVASPDSQVVEVKDDAHYDEIISSHSGLAVVDFTAAWCGPCKQVAPVFDSLSKEHTTVKFLKVDIDNEETEKTVRAAQVSAVPTFSFVKAGQLAFQIKGADIASVKAKIDELK
eukprot:CAMPEP_0114232914 /NCGR_PEP_ID=MMETSP0058-20121206/4870_1 /TAXON_ID=36894 /ORGANISM="Pyramimonas parkeae, CCMP726" /LENGTH=149 /DNA_ID=CAMNT_0001344439 /DNA_START=20 /DNA_END=469 /DNA_ORIENTATION=-